MKLTHRKQFKEGQKVKGWSGLPRYVITDGVIHIEKTGGICVCSNNNAFVGGRGELIAGYDYSWRILRWDKDHDADYFELETRESSKASLIHTTHTINGVAYTEGHIGEISMAEHKDLIKASQEELKALHLQGRHYKMAERKGW